MSDGPTRRPWLQFSTRGVFVATFWAAVFSYGLIKYNRLYNHELVWLESEELAYLAIGLVLFVSPLAAVGGLFGHAAVGALIGFGLYCAYVACVLVVISIVGI